ncbi:hypothetical protein Nepgr_020719 [Nepenthes gracilis]|uniref:Uncharacterized protein n=1 Tax=Nepenthes gracilis TaxID=150966 RepID=A0AAD3SWP4_NEPGR|nr:hypothetical protein Nepgr_020719 [Nepenthes gracilis]
MQNAALHYVSFQHPTSSMHNTVNVSPSVLVHRAFSSSGQNNSENGNGLGGKSMFSAGIMEHQLGSSDNINHNVSGPLIDNRSRVKAEGVQDLSSGTNLFVDHFGQEDLMSALLKQ